MEAQDNMENISVFLFFGLTTSSRAVSPQEHYNPELVHYHCATAQTGMHLIDKAFFFFFFRETENVRTNRLIVTHLIHISVTDLRKKGHPHFVVILPNHFLHSFEVSRVK